MNIALKMLYFLKYVYCKLKKNFVSNDKKADLKKKQRLFKSLLKSQSKIKVSGKNNVFDKEKIKSLNADLNINGNNNEIIIGENCTSAQKLIINIFGDNNKVYIGDNIKIAIHTKTTIQIGFPRRDTKNCAVEIGSNSFVGGFSLKLLEYNSFVKIGENAQISASIEFWGTDGHAIFDNKTNELQNYGTGIFIGKHCWIGHGVVIGKRARILDNSIVGINSVVASKFDEQNVVIAGNPARIVKRNINWSSASCDEFLVMQNGG